MNDLQQKIRNLVVEHGQLGEVPDLEASTDLYMLGMTSHSTVVVMLALEGAFDVEFPDRFLKRQVFGSIESIAQAVASLLGEPSSAHGNA